MNTSGHQFSEGGEEVIEWKICLDCGARNHPLNHRCDECGSKDLRPIKPNKGDSFSEH